MPASRSQCAFGYTHPELEKSEYLVFFDAERRLLSVSPQFCELLGYTAAHLLGLRFERLLPDDVEFNVALWQDFLETGYLKNFLLLKTRTGEVIGVHVNSSKLHDGCMVSEVQPVLGKA